MRKREPKPPAGIPLDWTAPIHLTEHCRERARSRAGMHSLFAIRGEIRSAIIEGRVTRRKPNWTRGLGHAGSRDGAWYLWDAQATRCWVLVRERRRHLTVLTVVTSATDDTAGSHLREGLGYAT